MDTTTNTTRVSEAHRVLGGTFLGGTDSGPTCSRCSSTIYEYYAGGNDGTGTVMVSCVGCRAGTQFRAPGGELALNDVSAAQLRQWHSVWAASVVAKIRFCFNGLRTAGGLQTAYIWYRGPSQNATGDEYITVSKKGYEGFSADVRDAFKVKNDTDSMTDYFEKDSFDVRPGHPLWMSALLGYLAAERKNLLRMAARASKAVGAHKQRIIDDAAKAAARLESIRQRWGIEG